MTSSTSASLPLPLPISIPITPAHSPSPSPSPSTTPIPTPPSITISTSTSTSASAPTATLATLSAEPPPFKPSPATLIQPIPISSHSPAFHQPSPPTSLDSTLPPPYQLIPNFSHPPKLSHVHYPNQNYTQFNHTYNHYHIPTPQDSRTQLYVNNLPFRVRWQDLKDLFRKAGTVLRADVSLTPDNRSKGFGTVLFANRADAYKALEIYHGFSWQTRILDVRFDQQDPTGALAMAASAPPPPPPPAAIPPNHQSTYQSSAVPPKPAPIHHVPQLRPSTAEWPTTNLNSILTTSRPSPNSLDTSTPTGSINRQPLIPIEKPNPALPTFNPALRPAHHRSSQSLHLPPTHHSLPSSSSSTTNTPAKHLLDALQPAFQPAALAHNVSQLALSTSQCALPSPPRSAASQYLPVPIAHEPTHAHPPRPVIVTRPGRTSYHNYGPMPGHVPSHGNAPGSYTTRPASGQGQRHLFVGNLPFTMQWQDLKDLFREAGQILRADVAIGADGRSRGFGTVLYGTSEDAARAVGMYDGYELKGRVLKVHVDRFAQAGRSELGASYSGPPPQADVGAHADTGGAAEPRTELWAPEPAGRARVSTPIGHPSTPLSPIASRRSSCYKGAQTQPIGHPGAGAPRPQSIPMPPPYDLTGAGSATMSPPIPRVVQMTPSMPAFSFQAFQPATPPLLPKFFSPGIGPSTPPGRAMGTMPKPTNSPLGHNPMFPEEDDDAEEIEEESPEEKRAAESNVDWGYQTQVNGVKTTRRASLFVATGSSSAGSAGVGRSRLLGGLVGGLDRERGCGIGRVDECEEEAAENFRRASFDVGTLANGKLGARHRAVNHQPKSSRLGPNHTKEDHLTEVNGDDLLADGGQGGGIGGIPKVDKVVGLGFVDSSSCSIWKE